MDKFIHFEVVLLKIKVFIKVLSQASGTILLDRYSYNKDRLYSSHFRKIDVFEYFLGICLPFY